jgi:hypothetical protein
LTLEFLHREVGELTRAEVLVLLAVDGRLLEDDDLVLMRVGGGVGVVGWELNDLSVDERSWLGGLGSGLELELDLFVVWR